MLYRLSFQQLLLLSFLLVAALLGAAALQGLVTLEQLVGRSHEAVERAVALSADAQRLSEDSVSMERAARQYMVLGDQALLQRFEATASDSTEVLARLAPSLGDAALPGRWQQQTDLLRAHFHRRPAAGNRQTELNTVFHSLGQINATVADAVRQSIRQQNTTMLAELDTGRQLLQRNVLATLALAVCMALAFGFWLGRPLKRLEAAIEGLGSGLDLPIDVKGPRDMQQLGHKLDWLRLQLAELEADKARFLRHISHELKTPLTSMREGVALLHDGVTGELNADQQQVVRILQQHTARLQKQIEDLLRLNTAAFEARKLRREAVEIETMAYAVVEAQRLQWQGKRLTVSVTGGPLLLDVDKEKFATALSNLLANAIRFSPPDGSIRMILSPEAGRACIDIVDTGPGVAAPDRNHVFEPFYRGSRQMPGEDDGNGIGLSIVQEYVIAHGGRVSLLADNPGAHFRIEMPYANAL